MRIQTIKLLSDYKLFTNGQVFNFGFDSVNSIVGINGSGKSILLEMVSNIFVDIANYATKKYYNNIFEYDIKYNIKTDAMNYSVINSIDSEWNEECIDVNVVAEKDILSMWVIIGNEKVRITDSSSISVFMPRKVVVYSSGHNECISDQIVMFKYLSLLSEKVGVNNIIYSGDVNDTGLLSKYNDILYYIDDEISQLAIISTYLSNISIIVDSITSSLSSFSFLFDNTDAYKKEILFDDKVKYIFNRLNINRNTKEFKYSCTDKTILNEVGTLALFEGFQRLYTYNIYKIKMRLRSATLSSNERNMSKYINECIGSKFVFRLQNIIMNWNGIDMDLKSISDGEFQLLQLVCILTIFEGDNVLYLFDEPETHFNPSWKSKFVSQISSKVKESSQFIFTTHNPEVITDLHPNNILLMKSGKQKYFNFETFGTNSNIINSMLFDKADTISQLASDKVSYFKNKINNTKDLKTIRGIEREIIYNLGDSVERLLLLMDLRYKKESLKS